MFIPQNLSATGRLSEPGTLTLNGNLVAVGENQEFTTSVILQEGLNTLVPFHSIKCPIRCSVTPAEAGVQRFSDHVWIPAFAGMTGRERYFGYSIVWRCT
jgi:hypothetical protein